jgi:hypothetical protein
MLSISSIFSAISGNVGALGRARETNAPGNNIAKYSEAVDDVVNLSGQGIEAASRAQPEISSRSTERNITSPTTKPDKSQQIISQLQQTNRAVRTRTPEESIERVGTVRAAALAPADPSPQKNTVTPAESTSPAISSKPDNPRTNYGLAVYQETSSIFDQQKPKPSIRVSA